MASDRLDIPAETIESSNFDALLTKVEELTTLENKLYGREFKTRDHLLAFLSAGNVSQAKIMINGELEDLDKRVDKPLEKDCELTEAAKAIHDLQQLVYTDATPEQLVKLAVHGLSEVGDVFYNIIQLYQMQNLPNGDYIKHTIIGLFTEHNLKNMNKFMLEMAVQKFSIRYEISGKKDVDFEESELFRIYNESISKIIYIYGGIDRLLATMKQIVFNCLPISIIAAGGDDYMINQIITTATMMKDINKKP